jgi:hypothetical protein
MCWEMSIQNWDASVCLGSHTACSHPPKSYSSTALPSVAVSFMLAHWALSHCTLCYYGLFICAGTLHLVALHLVLLWAVPSVLAHCTFCSQQQHHKCSMHALRAAIAPCL